MTPATYDFQTIGGNTLPINLRLRRFDASGSEFVFRCLPPSAMEPAPAIRKSSADATILVSIAPDAEDPAYQSTAIALSLSPAETRLLGEGRVNRYELERRIAGVETTILSGFVVATTGVNDDA